MAKLITKAQLASLPELHTGGSNPLVRVKIFNPGGAGTIYITEGIQERGDWRLYGFEIGQLGPEYGYYLLSEMAAVRNHMGLPLERDLYFAPVLRSTLLAKLDG